MDHAYASLCKPGISHCYSSFSSAQVVSQMFPSNSTNICLVEHRSFPTSEDGMSAASFLHSSFDLSKAINAVMPWLFHTSKVPQVSKNTPFDAFYSHGFERRQ